MKYQKIKSFKEIFSEIDNWNSDYLILFDIDLCTIMYKDKLIRNNKYKNIPRYIKKINEIGLELFIKNLDILPCDSNLYRLFQELENKNIPYIGLTARKTGKITNFKNSNTYENLLINKLNKLGITFNPYDYPNNIILNNSPKISKIDYILSDINEMKILCKDGIIFCCNKNKGIVLNKYIENSIRKPKHIVFFDDQITNLIHVNDYCEGFNIKCNSYLVDFKKIKYSNKIEIYYSTITNIIKTNILVKFITLYNYFIYLYMKFIGYFSY